MTAQEQRDAHWRAARDAIAFGVMATDEVWHGSSWDRNRAGTSKRLDDLTDQYMQQVPEAATSPEGGDLAARLRANRDDAKPEHTWAPVQVDDIDAVLDLLDRAPAPSVATPPQTLRITDGYVEEYTGACTCGGEAPVPPFSHEPHCGWELVGELWNAAATPAEGESGDATCRHPGVSLPPQSYLEQER